MASQQKRPRIDPEAELLAVRKKLEHPSREDIKYWLDTGDPALNAVFGSKVRGIPYGKQIELSGWESHGKSAIGYGIAAAAQRDGARVAIWDLEDSTDEMWMIKRGLKPEEVLIFKSVVGKFPGEKKKRPITAEEQCDEIETWMDTIHEGNPTGRIFILIDSIAAMTTHDEESKGIANQNMRTKVSVAQFLTFLLKRWQNRAPAYNLILMWLNQIRVAPGKWGNPEYTPGGNALRFYCASRVKTRKVSDKVLKSGNPIGIKGILTNYKNKTGEESEEGLTTGFKLYYDGRLKTVPAEEVKPPKKEK